MGVDYFDFARFCPNSYYENKYVLSSEQYRNFFIDILRYYQELLTRKCHIRLLFREHLWILLFYNIGIIDNEYLNNIIKNRQILCGCSMGNNNGIVINYNGNVLPCAKLPKYILGNILYNDLEDILNSSKFKLLSSISAYEDCKQCDLALICRGCPAISNAVKGNLFLKDPQCWNNNGGL